MKALFLYLNITGLMFLIQTDQLSAQNTALDNLSNNLPSLEKNFNLRVLMTVDSSTRLPLRTQVQVNNILEKATSYFQPIGMSFSSCSYDVIENYAYNNLFDTVRVKEMGVVYGYPKRINIFFVNNVVNNDCGFSYLGGFSTRRDAQIYIELNCTDEPAEQIAKHMGRLLGLLNTNHEGYTQLANSDNCLTTGDKLCSTQADPFGYTRDASGEWTVSENPILEAYYNECEFIWEELDDNGDYYTPSMTNMMSPYPCKCHFTEEQFRIMIDAYHASPYKQY